MPLQHRLHARCGCSAAHGSQLAASARPFAFATSPRQFERDRPFLIAHLAVDLLLDLARKSVSGVARIDIQRVDASAETVAFDAIGFDVKSVKVDGKGAHYLYDGRTISVSIGKAITAATVTIAYRATPRRGLYFLEPDEHVPNRPRQVWSQCQEEDARHFIPCHDKPHLKMTTEMNVTAPNGWYVLSNGELLSRDTPSKGGWTYHWKMSDPHPSYLLTLVAGQFAEISAKAKGVPLTYLVPEGQEELGRRTFARTPDMVNYFGELTGVAYPWNKYAQVVVSDFIFGGMENTTATTMYEHILLDRRAELDVTSDDLIAHELAHQWFGDYVTCRDWSEAWLNEGFATYMEHVWKEKHLGRDEYDYGVKTDLGAYVGEASGRYRRAIVCSDYDSPLDLFDRHLYEKGGLVLHALRTELGADVFWRGVGVYLARNARGIVETRDLQRALEEVSGKSLGRLFDQAVYKPGHPEIDVTIAWDRGVLKVTAKQEQAVADGVPAVFEVPLVVDIYEPGEVGGKRVRREQVLISQKVETFVLPCAERPRFVVVDPEMRIVGQVQTHAPNDMLRAQLEGAKPARGRWLAADALSRSDDAVTIRALKDRLADAKEFWGVRADCAEALGKIRAKEGFLALVLLRDTAHPKVRRAIVSALGRFKTPAAAEALRPRALKDASYLVEAEAARALGKTRQASAFDTLIDVIDRPSWADVIRAGAIDGLAALRDDRATAHILARTRYGHPTRARRAAIMAIPKLLHDRTGREALEELLDDADPHLRIDVVRALVELGDPKARGPLKERLEIDLDARVRRRLREALRDLGGETKKSHDQLREELEKLQGELQEQKTRLAVLEAGGPKRAEKKAEKATTKAKTKRKTSGRKK